MVGSDDLTAQECDLYSVELPGVSRITNFQVEDPRTEAKKVIEIEPRQLVHLFAVGMTIHNLLSDGGLALLGGNMDDEIA
jgi:hypothetical protein